MGQVFHYQFISLIRGINVQNRKLKMQDLRDIYHALGVEQVKTYIQSGNVLFNSPSSNIADLTASVREMILSRYQLEVTIINRQAQQLEQIINHNPFVNTRRDDPEHWYVCFLEQSPDQNNIPGLPSDSHDYFEVIGQQIYLYYPDGCRNTKMDNNFFERQLKIRATTRNWRTINKIYQLLITG